MKSRETHRNPSNSIEFFASSSSFLEAREAELQELSQRLQALQALLADVEQQLVEERKGKETLESSVATSCATVRQLQEEAERERRAHAEELALFETEKEMELKGMAERHAAEVKVLTEERAL